MKYRQNVDNFDIFMNFFKAETKFPCNKDVNFKYSFIDNPYICLKNCNHQAIANGLMIIM